MCGIIVLSVIAVIVGFILIFIIEYWEFLLAFLILTVVIAIIAVKYESENGTGEKRDLPQKSYEPHDNSVKNAVAAAALIDLIFSDNVSEKRHKGYCDGDCRNCPPHYGYRYGRWYYGRCHTYGCQLGGNRGDGAMD